MMSWLAPRILDLCNPHHIQYEEEAQQRQVLLYPHHMTPFTLYPDELS